MCKRQLNNDYTSPGIVSILSIRENARTTRVRSLLFYLEACSSCPVLYTLSKDKANKQTKVNTYALIPWLTLSHLPDLNLGEFRSRLGASRVSSYTEEL